MDAEFATGFFNLFFIFGSTMVKIIKCIFPPGRSWKIYIFKKIFLDAEAATLKPAAVPLHDRKIYKKYCFLPEGVGKIIKSIFVSGCGSCNIETCGLGAHWEVTQVFREAQVGIMDAQVVLLFYFFCNMQRIKINLCTEVAAFFSIAWKQLLGWMLSLPQGFYIYF